MPHLDVPGATLHYETVGKGPVLLCVSGANGSVRPWRTFASHLAESYTVIMYDRRGFSQSFLTGAQDYEHRLDTDADDAALLVRHVSHGDTAFVIGNSSGAIVTLQLVLRHPDLIKTAFIYEPPAAKLLPDADELWALQNHMYQTYRQGGAVPAMEEFTKFIEVGIDREGLAAGFNPANDPYIHGNFQYWFEREVLTYPFTDFDLEDLKIYRHKIVLILGRQTHPGVQHYRAVLLLAEKLDLTVNQVPGAHLGFATHPADFAQTMKTLLEAKI